MASQLHTYTARVSWSGGREGNGTIQNEASGQGFDIRVPTEFGGEGGALNPEELLTDAIAGCYSITFGIVATNRRIPLKSVEVEAVGTVDQNGANFVYKSVALSPKITLGAEATDQDIATAVDMAHKADSYCIVTNAVRGKVEVSISPSVQREGETSQPTKPVSGDQTLDAPYVAQGASTVSVSDATAPKPITEIMTTSNDPDTAPKPETSYEGSQQSEDAYAEAGDAAKPSSATGTASESPSPEKTPKSDDAPANGEQASRDTGPENSDADDVQATSKETGNPDSMEVGAIPG